MAEIALKIRDFFYNSSYFGYLFIGAISAAIFAFIQSAPVFADPDSFYHAKMAELMLREGIVKNFPWLAFTALPKIYTDHHFLYHIFLMPFVKFFNPLIGIKVATTIINTGFILLFYYFLKSQKAKWPALFTLLLLGSAPFMFRINLAKANGFSLIFVFLILILMFRKTYRWLFVAGFFYVWSYGGWPLSVFIAGAYFIASLLAEFAVGDGKFFKNFITGLKVSEWRPLAALAAGSAAGLMINPYFPRNIVFYWIQTVQIALVNYGAKIGVGAEWYPFNLPDLISYAWPVFLFILLAFLFFAGRLMIKNYPLPSLHLGVPRGRNSGEAFSPFVIKGGVKGGIISRGAMLRIFFFIIIGGIFFVLTLKSCRNTEYAFPFMLAGASFFLAYFWDRQVYACLKDNFLKILKSEIFFAILIAYVSAMLALYCILGVWRVKNDLSQGFAFAKYSESMEIARQNSAPGDIIFHSDWDDWPMLFYNNDKNFYIVGLDATFMYKHDSELYQKWRDITLGKFYDDPYSAIKNDFHAVLVFIADGDIDKMDKYFINDGRYELLYAGDGKLYKVR